LRPMSVAMCHHKRTHALRQIAFLFDHAGQTSVLFNNQRKLKTKYAGHTLTASEGKRAF
jgi:hypothetical protein